LFEKAYAIEFMDNLLHLMMFFTSSDSGIFCIISFKKQ